MGIKREMEKSFGVKKIKGEYVTKREYNKYRKNRNDQILEDWIEKQESFEDRQYRLRKVDPLEINDVLENIDRKFCIDIQNFINDSKHHTSFDEISKATRTGREIIHNFILERSYFLIKSNAIFIPNCKGEGDVQRWFEENCNNLCLGIPIGSIRHDKFRINDGIYKGVDYICNFIGGINDIHYHYCEDNYYRPFLGKYLNDNQKQSYYKFYEFVSAQSLLVELEYVSSNFIRHKHPNIIDIVICYEKDKEIGIPVLSINPPESKHVR